MRMKTSEVASPNQAESRSINTLMLTSANGCGSGVPIKSHICCSEIMAVVSFTSSQCVNVAGRSIACLDVNTSGA